MTEPKSQAIFKVGKYTATLITYGDWFMKFAISIGDKNLILFDGHPKDISNKIKRLTESDMIVEKIRKGIDK